MTFILFITRLFLLAFNLHMPVGKKFDDISTVEIAHELTQKKEKQKRLQKQIPVKRKRFVKERIDRRFKSTKAKDHRYSNQKSLRRMYRNC